MSLVAASLQKKESPPAQRFCRTTGAAPVGAVSNLRVSEIANLFFFSSRRRHTSFDCDWSSDVCSSDLAWLPLAYLISVSFFDTLTKTLLIVLIYANFWLLTGGDWQNLVFSLVTAITGTLIEMILVAAGAFAYLHPDMLGVPYWLPAIYACASLAVGDLGRSLFYPLGGSYDTQRRTTLDA